MTRTEGDAEALPFDAGRFDVGLSTFGCMFARRHEVAADEIARVLRPGGRMGVCSWTPAGVFGDLFRIVAGYLPPDPEFVDPPLLWGDESHLRELFEQHRAPDADRVVFPTEYLVAVDRKSA